MARSAQNLVRVAAPMQGVDGRTTLAAARAPTSADGRVGDFWVNTATKEGYGPKTAAGWGAPAYLRGHTGWTPVFGAVADGARRVLRVTDWTGDEGVKPATGKYIGATGFVDALADALDFRGEGGGKGDTGDIDSVTAFWTDRIQGDATAAAAREGLSLSYATTAQARQALAANLVMRPDTVFAQVRTLVQHISPLQPEFAGGMPVNDIDDDAASLRACLAHAGSISPNMYEGGAVVVKVPRGIMKMLSAHPTKADRHFDLTGLHNVRIEGEDSGSSTLRWFGNKALFRGDDLLGSPLSFASLGKMRLYGPGDVETNTNADAIDFGSINNVRAEFIDIYAARRAVAWRDAFHCDMFKVKANGSGGLACYDGFYAKDGSPGGVENAVRIESCRIWSAKRWGFRGENVTGTDVYSTEILGCGAAGVYLGESPTGKDLKWFSWFGGMIDTCGDLVVVKRGSSSVGELIHFTGIWDAYAFDPSPGVGIGVEFVGMKDCSFSAAVLANTGFAANLQDCDGFTLRVDAVRDYDNQATGGAAIILNNTRNSRIDVGSTRKKVGSAAVYALVEQGASDYNKIDGVFDGAVATVGAHTSKVGALVRP